MQTKRLSITFSKVSIGSHYDADDVGQAVTSNAAVEPVPVRLAPGPSSNGGGITPAAANAVAHIRRRRAAGTSSAPALEALAAETDAASRRAAVAAPSAACATTGAAGPSGHLDCGDDHSDQLDNAPVPCPANLPLLPSPPAHSHADAGGGRQSLPAYPACQADGDKVRAEQAVDRAGQAVTKAGQAVDKAGQAVDKGLTRPPLPFHPIRRSARLHKTSDKAGSSDANPAGSQQADLQPDHDSAAHAAADKPVPATAAAAEASGPCTR